MKNGFLYYLPTEQQTLARDDAHAAGLAYAFDGPDFAPRGCHGGPDNGHGVVCGVDAVGLGYYPDRQTWRRIPGNAAGAWLGWNTAEPPGPEELARTEQLAGYEVPLLDGRRWLCPIARGVADHDGALGWYVALPSVLELADDGRWTSGGVEARYRLLWGLAEAFWDAFSGAAEAGEGFAFDFQGLPDAAVACLAANYRIGRAEAAALGLFDHQGAKASAVLQALVDVPAWKAILKKKLEAEGSPTGGG